MKQKKFEHLAAEARAKIGEHLSRPRVRAQVLKSSLLAMKMDPPKTRSKKNANDDWPKPKKDPLRDAKWAATYPELYQEILEPLIKEALENGEAEELFATLSKGAAQANEPPPTTDFFRHVTSAMKVAIIVMEKQNRIPTKKEIRDGVLCIFEAKGWPNYQDCKSRWTEFFAAADLTDLPNR